MTHQVIHEIENTISHTVVVRVWSGSKSRSHSSWCLSWKPWPKVATECCNMFWIFSIYRRPHSLTYNISINYNNNGFSFFTQNFYSSCLIVLLIVRHHRSCNCSAEWDLQVWELRWTWTLHRGVWCWLQNDKHLQLSFPSWFLQHNSKCLHSSFARWTATLGATI